MTHIIHVQFNSIFNSFLDESHPDTVKAIMSTVADTTAEIIRSTIPKQPQKVDEELRLRVPSENIVIYAMQSRHVVVFIAAVRF